MSQPVAPVDISSPPAASPPTGTPRRRAPKRLPMWQRFDFFVGLDIHKNFVTVVILDTAQNVVQSSRKIEWEDFTAWAQKTLTPRHAVVWESTTNAYAVYDLVAPLAGLAQIAHVPAIHAKMDTGAKTDTRDAASLARLLLQGEFDKDKGHVWVPPEPIRELRILVATRYDLVGVQTMTKNHLHSILHRRHLDAPESSLPFSDTFTDFWTNLPNLPSSERVELRVHWALLKQTQAQIAEVEAEMGAAAAGNAEIQLLAQLTGFGMINAITVMAAIGDIRRFRKPGKLVRYAGLDSLVRQSAEHTWKGKISKAGRGDLRSAMVDVATHAAKHHHYWKREFARMEGKKPGVIYCAIARRLLIVVWHLLTDMARDKHGDGQQIANRYYRLYFEMKGSKNVPGGSALHYVRQRLDVLGIEGVNHIDANKTKKLRIPPSGEPPPEKKPPKPKRPADWVDGRSRAVRLANGRSKPRPGEVVPAPATQT